MTPERLDRLKEIFDAAVDVTEPAKRAAFLDHACGDDSELRAEVEQLLAQDEENTDGAGPFSLQSKTKALSEGTRLGPYEILVSIGAGATGWVYRARDTRLNRIVAVKVLAPQPLAHPTALIRFEREARAVASLSHPHICALYDIGYEGPIAYLVLEYLDGETLATRLARGRLDLHQALEYAVQIAEALDAAHRQGVIHRDLKPGNIMLTKTGAKLLDFSIAKVGAAERLTPTAGMPTASVSEEGTILGTLQYMAPEQLEGRAVDGRADVFGFGPVMYEMFTGQKAFSGNSKESSSAEILERDPPSITSLFLDGGASPSLNHVVRTCLAKQPGDRWQSAHDVFLQLKWIANNNTSEVATVPSAGRRGRRRELLFSGVVAA